MNNGSQRPLLRSLAPLFFALIFTVLQSRAAGAQVVAPGLTPDTIVVVGNGDMKVDANVARLNLGVEVVDETPPAAYRAARVTMQRVLAALAAAGIADEEITTYAYNINVERYYADYARDDPGTVPIFPDPAEEVRYRVIHQIHVNTGDLDQISELLDAAMRAGGNQLYVYGTDYLYDDPASLEPAARQRAMADAQAKAEELARLADVELGPILSISELVQGSGTFWENYLAPSLWPGQLRFYKQLQVVYATGAGRADAAAVPAASPTITATTAATVTGEAAQGAPEVGASVGPENSTDPSADPTEDTVIVYGGDEDSLREFVRHYLHQSFVPPMGGSTLIYVGALPPDLPFTLDLPAEISVAGSLVTTGQETAWQLLLAVDGAVIDSITALREQLLQQGYVEPASQAGGEVFASVPAANQPLCSADGTLVVMMIGRDLDAGSGLLRVLANALPAYGGPCGPSLFDLEDDFQRMMPELAAAPNVGVYSSGMSSELDAIESTIRFTGETTIAELAEHYFAELEANDWQQKSASQTEDVAWSSWSKSDGELHYVATFLLARNASEAGRFYASLRVELAK